MLLPSSERSFKKCIKLLPVFLLFVQIQSGLGQSGYRIDGTSKGVARDLAIDSDSTVRIQALDGTWKTFSARRVNEFTLHGSVYQSVRVNGKNIFMRRLTNGKLKLLRNGKLIGLKSGDTIVRLTKTNYREILEKKIDCAEGLKFAKFSPGSMVSLITLSDSGRCDPAHLPLPKFGVFGGYNFLSIHLSLNANSLTYSTTAPYSVATFGMFKDFPVYRPRNTYFSAELMGIYASPLFYTTDNFNTQFADMVVKALVAPLAMKFYLNEHKIKSYVKAGGAIGILNKQSEKGYVETDYSNGAVDIYRADLPSKNSLIVGFNSACGIEIPRHNQKKIFAEVKYLNLVDTGDKSLLTDISSLSILAGLNF